MNTDDTLFLDIDLPAAALLDWQNGDEEPNSETQTVHPNDAGAIWYRAHARAFELINEQLVRSWMPENGLGGTAVPVQPNLDLGRFVDPVGLEFCAGVNSGLVVKNALIDAKEFSIAIRFSAPENEARTLVTLNPDDHANYLFLKEQAGVLEWQDQNATASVSTASLTTGTYWVAIGFSRGALSIATSIDGTSFDTTTPLGPPNAALHDAMGGPSSLFIGARSHRKGILKTLGQSQIADILFWIDQDVLACATKRDTLLASACTFAQSDTGAP